MRAPAFILGSDIDNLAPIMPRHPESGVRAVSKTATTFPPPAIEEKRCECCGTTYSMLEWMLLQYIGLQDDGADGWLELRQCVCESTIAVHLEPDVRGKDDDYGTDDR